MPLTGAFFSYSKKCPSNVSNCGHFLSYWQKMTKQFLKPQGTSSVTVRKCLNSASKWGLRQLLSENASTMPLTEAFFSYSQNVQAMLRIAGTSSVTDRKWQNSSSNRRALLQLLSENASTVPRNGAFVSYCQKMPKQCLELGPSSVTVRKCVNNASNWGLLQLFSKNA